MFSKIDTRKFRQNTLRQFRYFQHSTKTSAQVQTEDIQIKSIKNNDLLICRIYYITMALIL